MPNLDLDALAKKAETLIEKKQQSRMTIKEMRDYAGLTNVHYAPGFATYGLRGLTKQFNSSAQSIYVSDIEYTKDTEKEILDKLKNGEPLSTRDSLVNLIATDKIEYHLGDLVITPNGNVYIVASVNSLKNTDITVKDGYTLILNFLFKIASKSFNQYNLENIKSLTIGDIGNNSSKGILTITSNSSSSKNPHVRLISTSNVDKADTIKFSELKIYYLTDRWIFESDDTLEFKANNIVVNKTTDQSKIISKTAALETAVNTLNSALLGITRDSNKITIKKEAKDRIYQITEQKLSDTGEYREIVVNFGAGTTEDKELEGQSFIIYLKDGHILRV